MTRSMVLFAAAALALVAAPDASPQDVPPAPQPKMTPAVAKAILDLDAEIVNISEALGYHAAVLRRARADCDQIEAELAAVTTRHRAGQATDADLERARRQVALAQRRVAVAQDVFREAESQYHSARDRLAFPSGRFGASVGGTLAVDIAFPADRRLAVAEAALALVTGATDSAPDVPAATWDAARRGCHILVRFPDPARTRVAVGDGPTFAVVEVLAALPLTRGPGGFVLVRDGDRIARLSKYPPEACARFQEALAAAVPAAR